MQTSTLSELGWPESQRRREVSAAALTFEQRVAPITESGAARRGGDAILFEARVLERGSVYVSVPTWAWYDSRWNRRNGLNNRERRSPPSEDAAWTAVGVQSLREPERYVLGIATLALLGPA